MTDLKSSLSYKPNVVEEAYALFLLRSVFNRDYASEDRLVLSSKHIRLFFSLSGLDRILLRHIWLASASIHNNESENNHSLTDIAQFHSCLRFIGIAQDGLLLRALASASRRAEKLRDQASIDISLNAIDSKTLKITPLHVMTDCLMSSANDLVPLPQFAGIEIPKLQVLQLIYEQASGRIAVACGENRKRNKEIFCRLYQQQVQMCSGARNGPLEDCDRTLHTSNLSSRICQDDTSCRDDEAIEIVEVYDGFGIGTDDLLQSTEVKCCLATKIDSMSLASSATSIMEMTDTTEMLKTNTEISRIRYNTAATAFLGVAFTQVLHLASFIISGIVLLRTGSKLHRTTSVLVILIALLHIFQPFASVIGVTNRKRLVNWVLCMNVGYLCLPLIGAIRSRGTVTVAQVIPQYSANIILLALVCSSSLAKVWQYFMSLTHKEKVE